MATPTGRVAGKLFAKIDGILMWARGNWTYNLGQDKQTAVVGADRIHGFKAEPQVPFIEGAITDRGDLDLKALVTKSAATVTLELANGKTVSLASAWYAGEGTVNANEGEVPCRFEGLSADEV